MYTALNTPRLGRGKTGSPDLFFFRTHARSRGARQRAAKMSPKGKSHAGPGAPRQGVFVAKIDELKGITVIDEYFWPAPRQRGGARGSGTRPHPVGAGGSGQGQATSSVAHTSSPTVAGPTPNKSSGDLLTAIADTAGSVVDSATQVMTGVVSTEATREPSLMQVFSHSRKEPGSSTPSRLSCRRALLEHAPFCTRCSSCRRKGP